MTYSTPLNGKLDQTLNKIPGFIGQITSGINGARNVYVRNSYAYVTSSLDQSLHIIDISDPYIPVIIGTLGGLENLTGIYISGNYAYVVSDSGNNSIYIIDISDPTTPYEISNLDVGTFTDLTNIIVSGKYAYITAENLTTGGLIIVDISNPVSPFIKGSLSTITNAFGIDIVGKYVYIACSDNQLNIVDVSDPSTPVVSANITDITNIQGARGISVRGKYAFVTGYNSNTFSVYDISDPNGVPVFVTSKANVDGGIDLEVVGKYAYISGSDKITRIDISLPLPSGPDALKEAGFISTSISQGIYIDGGYAYAVSANNTIAFTVIDLQGAYLPSLQSGSLKTDLLSVTSNSEFTGPVSITSGLNVSNGICVQNSITADSLVLSGDGNVFQTSLSSSTAATEHNNYILPPSIGSAGTLLKDALGDGVLSWGSSSGLFTESISTVSLKYPLVDTGTWNTISWSPTLKLFAAIAQSSSDSLVNTSPDGKVWTSATAPESGWTSSTWSPSLGIFLAVGNAGNRVMTSSTGTGTWITPVGLSGVPNQSWISVIWSEEKQLFVSVSNGGVMTSPDGTTWTVGTAPEANLWSSVAWSPEKNLFLCVSRSGNNRVMTSTIGTGTWITPVGLSGLEVKPWQSLVWASSLGIFVAVSSGSTNIIMTCNDDGETWIPRNTDSLTQEYYNISWAEELGYFIVTGFGKFYGSSSDGINWTEHNLPVSSDVNIRDTTWSPSLNKYVLIGGSLESFSISSESFSDKDIEGRSIICNDSLTIKDQYNYISILSPTLTNSYTITLPIAVGSAGTVLSDASGDGVLSWTSIAEPSGTTQGNIQLRDTAGTGFEATEDFTFLDSTKKFTVDNTSNTLTPIGSITTGITGIKNMVIRDNLVYITGDTTSSIYVVDISDPTTPVVISNNVISPSAAFDIKLVGNYAFVTSFSGGSGFSILDISDPTNITLISKMSSGTYYIEISGQYAYVSRTGDNYIDIYDISNPSSIISPVSSITGLSNGNSGMSIQGNTLFIAGYYDNNINVYDITDPFNASKIGITFSDAGLSDVQQIITRGNYLYVSCRGGDIFLILDITDPGNMTKVTTNYTPTDLSGGYSLEISGNFIYLITYGDNQNASPTNDGAIVKLDIRDPSNVIEISRNQSVNYNVNNQFDAYGCVTVNDKYIIVGRNSGGGGIDIYYTGTSDIININSGHIKATNLFVQDIRIRNNAMFDSGATVSGGVSITGPLNVAGGITGELLLKSVNTGSISTVGTTDNMNFVGISTDNSSMSSPRSVFISGNYAYISSNGNDRLVTFDISDPTKPIPSGFISDISMNGATDVFVSGNYAYVVGENTSSLQIIDITDPTNPVKPATGTTGAVVITGVGSGLDCQGVIVDGNYAYIACKATEQLAIVDVSDPASPVNVVGGQITVTGTGYGLAKSGNFVYVTCDVGTLPGISVVDVSVVTTPSVVNTVTTSPITEPRRIAISGSYAYVADKGNHFIVIDITTPASADVVGSIKNNQTYLGDATGVTVDGNYAYVASESSKSLAKININTPTSPYLVNYKSNDQFLNAASVSVSNNFVYMLSTNSNTLSTFTVDNSIYEVISGKQYTREMNVKTSSFIDLLSSNKINIEAPILSLGYNLTLPTTSGTANQVLSTGSTPGTMEWVTPSAPPASSAGGSDTQIQFNNSTAFAGSADLTWDGTSLKVTDNKDITVGTDDDLILSHNGADSFITSTTGTLNIVNSNSSDTILKLGDASGATNVIVTDSGDATVFTIDSDGVTTLANTTASTTPETGALIVSGGIGAGAGITAEGTVQSNTGLILRETTATTPTETISLVAPTEVTSTYTLTLPPALGSNNQLLKTDASGVLKWTDVSSGIFEEILKSTLKDSGASISNMTSVVWSPTLQLFTMVGFGSNAATSSDGINWTDITLTDGTNWTGVTASSDKIVAIAKSTSTTRYASYSTDGINWISSDLTWAASWNGVVWANGLSGGDKFVAISSSSGIRVSTSTDGISWANNTGLLTSSWQDIAWSPELGLLIAVGSSGTNRVMHSSLGTTGWSDTTSGVAENSWKRVIWASELSLFVALASSGTNRIMYSANGIDWTGVTSADDTVLWTDITWSPELNLLIAVGGGTVDAMTSPDAINWTILAVPNSNYTCVEWSSSLRTAVAGTTGANTLQINTNAKYSGNVESKKIVISENAFSVTLQNPVLAADYSLTLPVDTGTVSQVLSTDGSGVLNWITPSVPASGSNTQIQFNNSTAFAGSADLTWDGTSLKVTDNKEITVGTDDDLILSHNGANSFITSTTGTLNIVNSNSSDTILKLGDASGATNVIVTDSGDATVFTIDSDGVTTLANTTASTTPTTGALIVSGGIGAGAGITAEGTVQSNTGLILRETTAITPTETISLVAPDTVTSTYTLILPPTVGTADQVLSTGSTPGTMEWVTSAAGGSAAGEDTQIQFNTGGSSFAGSADLTWDGTNISTSGGLKLKESAGDNTHYITLQAPASLDSDISLTFPANTGAASEFLQTDGSGNLVWSAASGGSSSSEFVSASTEVIDIQTISESSITLAHIAWSPTLSIFVIVTSGTVSFSSPDGINWTERTAIDASWYGLIWAPAPLSKFVAIAINGTNRLMHSSDGITWSQATNAPPAASWRNIGYSPTLGSGSGRLVAVTSTADTFMYSDDGGDTWITSGTTTPTGGVKSVSEPLWISEINGGSGAFICAGYNSDKIYKSVDGLVWTESVFAGGSFGANGYKCVAWSPTLSKIVILGHTLKNIIYSTDEGVTWSDANVTNNTDASWRSIIWSTLESKFIAVSSSAGKCIMVSSDGETWEDPVDTELLYSIAESVSLEKLVACGFYSKVISFGATIKYKGSIIGKNLKTDNDLILKNINIKARNNISPFNLTLPSTAGSKGNILKTSSSGLLSWENDKLQTSLKSTVEYFISADEAVTWRGIEYSSTLGIFVAVGLSGTDKIMYSYDGETWETSALDLTGLSASNQSWSAIKWIPEPLNKFVICAQSGGTVNNDRIAYSSDGFTWLNINSSNNGSFDSDTPSAFRSIVYSVELDKLIVCSASPGDELAVLSLTSDITNAWSLYNINSNSWGGGAYVPELKLFFIPFTSSTNAIFSYTGTSSWSTVKISDTSASWYDAAWSPELGVMCVCGSSTVNITRSSGDILDPDSWTEQSTGFGPMYTISWVPELSLFVGVGNNIQTSPDGLVWTQITLDNQSWGHVYSPEHGKLMISSTYGTNRIASVKSAVKNMGNFETKTLSLQDLKSGNTISIETPDLSSDSSYKLILPSDTGTVSQFLSTDGSGVLNWATPSVPSAGGSNTQIQFNSSTAFSGSSDLTWNDTAKILTTESFEVKSELMYYGSTSGVITTIAPATVTSYTMTLPPNIGSAGSTLVTDGSGNLTWSETGSATQLTSITTDVTINKYAGRITCFNTSTVQSNNRVNFTFYNSFITNSSVLLVSLSTTSSGVENIFARVRNQQNGFCLIDICNCDDTNAVNYQYFISFHVIN